MSETWNPWHELAARPHITLKWVEGSARGCFNFLTSTMTLRLGMRPAEGRSVVSHELIHDERGPFPRWLRPREEEYVRQESARRLIDIRDLAAVLQWAYCIEEAAEDLLVDVPTLRTRLDHLHPSERALIARALDEERDFESHVGQNCPEEA